MSDDSDLRLPEVLDLVRAVVPLDIAETMDADTSLEGALDSFVMVEILVETELVLGVAVDTDQIEAEDFRSARTIAKMIARFA